MNGNVPPQSSVPASTASPTPPRLFDQLHDKARQRGHSEETITAFIAWSTAYIRYHGLRLVSTNSE